LIFDTLFKGIIDYQIQLRYYLTFAPLLVFLAALLLDEALKGITAISRSRFSPIVPALWALLGIFSLLSFNHAVDGIMDRNKTSIRTDWRSLYALLDTLPQGSNAYLFNIVPVDRWSPPRFYATRFYYPKDGPHKVKLFTRDWLLPHYRDAEALWENDLVIVVPYGFSSIRPVLFSKMKQVVAYRFTQMSVVRIRFDGEMRHRVREVFEVLAEHLTKTEAHYKVFETVGWMRLLDGDRAGAREMIRILQAMDLRGMLLPEVITPLIAGVSHFKNM
jgi:hypothetical protein